MLRVSRPLREQDPLARFLYSRHAFVKSPSPRAKWLAFEPRHGNLSTFDISGLARPAVLELTERNRGVRKESLKGFATVTVGAAQALGLSAERTPPERHVDLTRWPSEPEQVQSIAQSLADAATVDLV